MEIEAVLGGSPAEEEIRVSVAIQVAHCNSSTGEGAQVEALEGVPGVDWIDEIDAGLSGRQSGEEGLARRSGRLEREGFGCPGPRKDSRAQQHRGRKPGGGRKGSGARVHGGDIKR